MRLYEMKRLPNKAGIATLHFEKSEALKESGGLPFRKEGDIVLPQDSDPEFFQLKKGQQFLFRHKIDNAGDSAYWFGGTDEHPFLVRLNSSAFYEFTTGSEAGFYDSLKPRVINELEKSLKISCKRQGDIFSIYLRYNWEDITRVMAFFQIVASKEIEYRDVNNLSLFGTRHNISGLLTFDKGNKNWLGFRREGGIIGEGEIVAPDHALVKLNGPHLIAQARYLFSPSTAD